MKEARYIRRLSEDQRLEESFAIGSVRTRMRAHVESTRSPAARRDHHRRSDGRAAPCGPGAVAVRLPRRALRLLPGRLRGVFDAGATRIGLYASGGAAGTVASMIDHTLLKPDATRDGHREALSRSRRVSFRDRLRQSRVGRPRGRLLRGCGVGVCSVVGFPLGATTVDVKHYETRRAIFDGAAEIDMVINIGALKSGDLLGSRATSKVSSRAGKRASSARSSSKPRF